MEDGARVLGNIELKGRTLHLPTNSVVRAQKGTVLVLAALGDLTKAPLTEIRTVDQMMAVRPARNESTRGPELPPEIAKQIVHDLLDKQYRATLDQPVGMLGYVSPREAVKTAKVVKRRSSGLSTLKIGRQTARSADPMTTYDFRWMWSELGIQSLRR